MPETFPARQHQTTMRTKQLTLFGVDPEEAKQLLLKPLQHRIWTEHKAKLVERYLFYFLALLNFEWVMPYEHAG
jgi:hypothetical protein